MGHFWESNAYPKSGLGAGPAAAEEAAKIVGAALSEGTSACDTHPALAVRIGDDAPEPAALAAIELDALERLFPNSGKLESNFKAVLRSHLEEFQKERVAAFKTARAKLAGYDPAQPLDPKSGSEIAAALRTVGRREEADRLALELYRDYPDDPAPVWLAAEIQCRPGGDPKRARGLLLRALELDPACLEKINRPMLQACLRCRDREGLTRFIMMRQKLAQEQGSKADDDLE